MGRFLLRIGPFGILLVALLPAAVGVAGVLWWSLGDTQVGSAVAREPGVGQDVAVVRGVPITVFTYRPSGCEAPALLFVFHGQNRNADDYRDRSQPLADRACLVVLAPEFDRERFPNWRYQGGGIARKGRVSPSEDWTVALVTDLVDWARQLESRPNAPFYLFGHSAGGQFLSRVAAFAPPPGAARIVIANPSTHVVASLTESVPYGLGRVFDEKEAEVQLRAYLHQPVTIYLGAEDTGERNLVQNAAAKRQGKNRLDRGSRVFEAARSLAREKGWAFNWKLVEAAGIGHSSRRMLAASEADQAFAFSALEESTTEVDEGSSDAGSLAVRRTPSQQTLPSVRPAERRRQDRKPPRPVLREWSSRHRRYGGQRGHRPSWPRAA